jgi:hypothetical protein
MKTILKILLILIIILYSCGKIDNKYFYLDHSVWFKYNANDTLIYKGLQDTDIYLINKTYTAFYIFDKKNYNEYFCVEYKCLTDSINLSIYGFCRYDDEIDIITKYSIEGTTYDHGTKMEYVLGDSLIHDVYKIECIRVDSIEHKVKTYYYSDIYGIIRYDMYNDEVFELQLK